MDKILLYTFKIINRLFGSTMAKARFFNSWKYLYGISMRGIGRIQGWPIEKSGELDMLRKLLQQTPDRGVVIDVGSNIGQYAHAVMSQVQEGRRLSLHMFEPSAANLQLLHEQFNPDKYPNAEFHINQVALSDKDDTAYLYTDKEGSDLGSLLNLKLPIRPFDESKKETVQTRKLDHYITEKGVREVELLKIDVEGAEYMVLSGAMDSIRKGMVKHIQFEFGAGNISSRMFFHDFWELLSPYYRFHLILSGGLVPIEKYSTDWEIFRTVNYLLIKK